MNPNENNPKVQIFRVGTLTLLLLSIFLVSKVVTEIINWTKINENYPQNTIYITGEGEAVSIPDVATFTYSVDVTKNSLEEAQADSAKKINDTLEYLKAEGVEEKDVKAISYNAYPKYEYPSCYPGAFDCISGNPILIGYEVSQTVEVKVRQTEKAGKLLSGIGSKGITNVSGLSFTIDDPTKLEEEARSIAISDAKNKADKLVNDLGVKLGRVVSFSEDSGYYPEPYYMDMNAKGMGDSAVAPGMPTGENKVKRTVYITYEIK